jgi:ADP-ribose pyrophosphatase YjhB (NUDIX family)
VRSRRAGKSGQSGQAAPAAESGQIGKTGPTEKSGPAANASQKSAVQNSNATQKASTGQKGTAPQKAATAKSRPAQKSSRRSRPRLQRVDEVSAGGLVVDLSGAVPQGALIGRIDRRGRLLWSLPKGHLEAGETAEQAAVREIHEETGICGEILATLGTIDFWFIAEGRRVHKTVHHFLLRATGGELSDADIEVSEVAWVPLSKISARLAYPDERGLVDTAGRLLAETA